MLCRYVTTSIEIYDYSSVTHGLYIIILVVRRLASNTVQTRCALKNGMAAEGNSINCCIIISSRTTSLAPTSLLLWTDP